MSIKNRLNLQLLKDGVTQTTTIPITVVSRKKFSYNQADNYKQDTTITKATLDAIVDPVFSAGKCDNFVISYVLNVFYKADTTKTFASFTIEKAELNLVYGSLTV